MARLSVFGTPARLSRRAALGMALAGALPLRRAFAAGAEKVKIRDLWAEHATFSDLAQRLDGKQVEMRGYMAPPLKPEIDFFVLTRVPMSVCPFCDNEASWPDDLVLVKAQPGLTVVPFNEIIIVRGQLELGTRTDAETGFVSRVRLLSSSYESA